MRRIPYQPYPGRLLFTVIPVLTHPGRLLFNSFDKRLDNQSGFIGDPGREEGSREPSSACLSGPF